MVQVTFNLAPGVQGGHGWHPNAYSPDENLLYIATQDAWFPMAEDPRYTRQDTGFNLAIDFGAQVGKRWWVFLGRFGHDGLVNEGRALIGGQATEIKENIDLMAVRPT